MLLKLLQLNVILVKQGILLEIIYYKNYYNFWIKILKILI